MCETRVRLLPVAVNDVLLAYYTTTLRSPSHNSTVAVVAVYYTTMATVKLKGHLHRLPCGLEHFNTLHRPAAAM